mmetsp:Transcript_28563/g.69452  ORF Transcript_28563/g.69452 Transcript_28563/m.69452 type:complete len:83 (+) Transcript_28563:725-973(+)
MKRKEEHVCGMEQDRASQQNAIRRRSLKRMCWRTIVVPLRSCFVISSRGLHTIGFFENQLERRQGNNKISVANKEEEGKNGT